jgi:hypothetical protein
MSFHHQKLTIIDSGHTWDMMDMGGVLVVAMVLMMVVMCGGMVGGAVWAVVHRRRDQSDE